MPPKANGLGHLDAGQAVQADKLDQPLDLRLSTAQQQCAASPAQAAGQQCEVDHERCVGERQLREVHNDVCLGAERSRKSSAPASLSRPVRVPATVQRRRRVIEVDDSANLAARGLACKEMKGSFINSGAWSRSKM